MPRKIPETTKREAVGILQIHDDISLTHYVTGVHRRTLRRWREELKDRPKHLMSEKTFSSDTKPTQNIFSDTKTPAAEHSATSSADALETTAVSDYENLTHIRGKLLNYARRVADGLSPDQADGSRRTLALSRVLDRIQLLDQALPKLQPTQRPPWQDAYDALLELDFAPWELIKIEEEASELDENLRSRVYDYYTQKRREEQTRKRFW